MPGEGSFKASTDVAIVERLALLTWLRDHEDVPVMVVHAAAGFGKTTLASQWSQRDSRPHMVVRIARFLDDPPALALALINALEAVGPPGAGEIRAVTTEPEPLFSASLLPSMTRLAASRQGAFVLVVDDIQLLTRPACHALLQAVADGVPAGSQIVFLSRLEPPTWLARTRSEGRLIALGQDDLAFDDEESRRLLDNLGIDSTSAVATDIIARAEGWPVGLYLMALSLRSRSQKGRLDSSFLGTGADRFVVDYLRAEILTGLPKRMRDFLRRTSILDEFDGSLCDAVLGRRDSAAVLSKLAHRLQLVVPLDPQGRRYRYHHLLADALLADLEGQEPWLVSELHLRAADWHELRGDDDAAIWHAKAAGDHERTGKLVWAGTPGCIAYGRPDRLASWLADLGDVQVRSNRWLTLAAAWLGLQTGDADHMTHWILAAEDHAGRDWTTRVATDEYAAFLSAIHAVVGDFGLEGTIELCRAAQRGLPRASGFRAAAFLSEGVALILTHRLPEGLASLQQAEQLGSALSVPIIEANALAWQGTLALLDDDWSKGAPMIARAADLIRIHGLDRLATSAVSVTALALLQAGRGNKDQARATLGTARRLTSQVSQIAPWFAVVGPLTQARAAILLGDGPLARTLSLEAKTHLTADLADTLLTDFLADTEIALRDLQSDGLSAVMLTTAELRVLQFLPSRLTFRQIGEHLFLSQSTIKTHARAIYRKLGATSRDQAVARAQSLGMVEPLLVT